MPRLVLLYAPCTVSKQYLSPYAPSVGYTPHLESFAEDSVVFRRHQTEAGQSGIAYASIFSGAGANRHGAFRHPVTLSDDLYLVAEAFADQGYETFFWNGQGMGGPNYGQGVPAGNLWKRGLVANDARFQAILERLRYDEGYRAFVMTNFSVTHGPYRRDGVGPFRQRHPAEAEGVPLAELSRLAPLYERNHIALSFNLGDALERLGLSENDRHALASLLELLYKANVERLDAMFGAVVDAVDAKGLRDDSLVVFTGDHGELFYREDELFQWSHAMQIPADVLRVPLLVRSPDPRIAPGAYEGVTRSIDVFPTLAGLAGFSLPEDRGIEGVDLSPVLRGEREAPELAALSHTTVLVRSVYKRMQRKKDRHKWSLVERYFPDEEPEHMWVAVREGDRLTRWKKLEGGDWGFEFVDLGPGPAGPWRAIDPEDEAHASSVARLREYKALLVAAYQRMLAGESLLPAEEEAQALRELGYIE